MQNDAKFGVTKVRYMASQWRDYRRHEGTKIGITKADVAEKLTKADVEPHLKDHYEFNFLCVIVRKSPLRVPKVAVKSDKHTVESAERQNPMSDRPTDRRSDGRTHSLIEMRSRI